MTFDPVFPVALIVVLAVALIGIATAGFVRAGRRGIRLAWASRALMVVLIAVVALRPALPADVEGPTASGGLEVYFAVDTTSSMAAEDFDGFDTRLSGAKADIAAIADRLPGAQFSLVTFDSSTLQRVPLTTDATALVSASSVMTQEVTSYSRGSSVDEPVALLTRILTSSKEDSPGNRRALFYLGDGEQTASEDPGPFDALAPLVDGGGVLGYGTAAGGRMLDFDGFGDDFSELSYIYDYSQDPPSEAVSRIDEQQLGVIAEQVGVPYTQRTSATGITEVVSGLDVGELTISPGEPGGPLELYWILAILLGILVLIELLRVFPAILELRPQREVP